MIQTAFKVVATFVLLVAGFLGYQRGFGVVARRFVPDSALIRVPSIAGPGGRAAVPELPPSFSQTRAMELARRAFGDDHWAARPDLTIRYYNAESGYWIYAGDYKRHSDGRRVEFFPFAVVLTAKDGQSFRSITGDRAYVDFLDPFDPFKPQGRPAHVAQARIDGEVVVRDYRDGGRGDLIIGPLTYLEYNEADLQIRTVDTPVTIRDRALLIQCVGIVIDLLPGKPAVGKQGAAVGFRGARGLRLLRDTRIVHEDVGKSGMLPGARAAGPADGGKTPFELSCDGEVQIDLPEAEQARPRPASGPAAPPPVVARFHRVVRLKRGAPLPDQLDCDDLAVNLVRSGPKAEGATAEGGDSFADLAIREARATGSGVWLQSPGQGFRALGNELIYRKNGPDKPDETYFRADRRTGLQIWKTDLVRAGPDAGKVASVTTIETIDATIFQGGGAAEAPGGGPMTVVARGPGRLETRPSPDRPAERVATWQDVLTLKSEPDGRRVLTLKDRPTFHDLAQAKIEAKDSLVVSLKPRPRPIEAAGPPRLDPWLGEEAVYAPMPEAPAGDATTGGSAVVEWIRAIDDVRLVATSTAAFAADGAQDAAKPAPARRAMNARKNLNVEFEPPPASPGIVRALIAPSAPTEAPGPAVPAAPAVASASPVPDPERPLEPGLDVDADTVWAYIAGPAGSTKGEVREVRLRGGVHVRREPDRGQALGIEVTGDAVDLVGKGDGRFEFRAHGTPARPAEVVSDTFQIVGPRLTLDQATDTAAVVGAGMLTHLIDGASRPFGGEAPVADRDAPAPARRPLVISWKKEMQFDGRTESGPGQARFLGGVEATVDGARITGEELVADLDRPVALGKPLGQADSGPRPDEPEGKPQIVLIRARRDVLVSNRKTDPSTGGLLEMQTIRGNDIAYDQPRRVFTTLGPGIVRLYKRGGDDAAAGPLALPGNRRVTPASGRAADPRAKAPLELTKVTFRTGMNGRFEGPPDKPADGDRIATFAGDVQMIHAKVADETADLSLDRPPAEFVALYSEYLRVESQPPPRSVAGATPPPARTLLMAQGGDREATARTQEATIVGDRIKYDSATGLFLVSGEAGREVNIARQSAPGQPISPANAQAVRYNTRTGEFALVKPESITFVDMKTGRRAGFVGPPNRDPQPKKAKREPTKRTDPGDKERRGYNGGQ